MALKHRFIEWDEPMGRTDVSPIPNRRCRATAEDCVLHWRQTHPGWECSDEDALDQFMVIQMAWEILPGPDAWMVSITNRERGAMETYASIPGLDGGPPPIEPGMEFRRAYPLFQFPEAATRHLVLEEAATVADQGGARLTAQAIRNLKNIDP